MTRMFDEMPNVYGEVDAVLYDLGCRRRTAHDFPREVPGPAVGNSYQRAYRLSAVTASQVLRGRFLAEVGD